MTTEPDPTRCADCGGPVNPRTDRLIHDRGHAFHRDCRRAMLAAAAERRSIRLTGRQLETGRALAEIQRRKPAQP